MLNTLDELSELFRSNPTDRTELEVLQAINDEAEDLFNASYAPLDQVNRAGRIVGLVIHLLIARGFNLKDALAGAYPSIGLEPWREQDAGAEIQRLNRAVRQLEEMLPATLGVCAGCKEGGLDPDEYVYPDAELVGEFEDIPGRACRGCCADYNAANDARNEDHHGR